MLTWSAKIGKPPQTEVIMRIITPTWPNSERYTDLTSVSNIIICEVIEMDERDQKDHGDDSQYVHHHIDSIQIVEPIHGDNTKSLWYKKNQKGERVDNIWMRSLAVLDICATMNNCHTCSIKKKREALQKMNWIWREGDPSLYQSMVAAKRVKHGHPNISPTHGNWKKRTRFFLLIQPLFTRGTCSLH